MLLESYRVLDQLRMPHGLYIASPSELYRYVWLRDSFYMSLPYLNKPSPIYERTFHRMFDLFREYEWKIDLLCDTKPTLEWEYIHARYRADSVTEIHDQEWGHVQHDMIGAFLFGIGTGVSAGRPMLRDDKDREIVGKLVSYLRNVTYWNDPDNGMWEEWRELHASSIGACVAGLKAVERIVDVPQELVQSGLTTLFSLFPRESETRPVDLALLSLIYPYRLYSGLLGKMLVANVERELLRKRGVIRYPGDSYYSTLEAEHGRGKPLPFYYGTEAEWTFGLPWLALCHLQLGSRDKAAAYIRAAEEAMTAPGVLPELYYSGTEQPNPNTPLGWSSAMYILAREAFDASTDDLST